ncbi:MAG: hypothetical protein ACREDR_34730, partial [Blastocatellia bacterium]
MAGNKPKKPNQKMQEWIDVRKRLKLSHAQVQMARELGMNPRKLPRNDKHKRNHGRFLCRCLLRNCTLSDLART